MSSTAHSNRNTRDRLFLDFNRLTREVDTQLTHMVACAATGQHASAGVHAANASIARNNVLSVGRELRKAERDLNGSV
jgi:hypothetical protein